MNKLNTLNTTYIKGFNVNSINKSQIDRKKLLSLLTKEEQQMFKAFVKSLES